MAQQMSREQRLALGIKSLFQPRNAEIVSGEYAGQKGTLLCEGPSHLGVAVSVFNGNKFVRYAGLLVFARDAVRLEA